MNSTNPKKKKYLFLQTVSAKQIPVKNIGLTGISSKVKKNTSRGCKTNSCSKYLVHRNFLKSRQFFSHTYKSKITRFPLNMYQKWPTYLIISPTFMLIPFFSCVRKDVGKGLIIIHVWNNRVTN